MTVDHRAARAAAVEPARDLASPPASRLRLSRWRDPRLWLGVVLVLASIVVGARVLVAADDTVAVWVLDVEGTAGMDVGADSVRAVDVHFADTSDARRYLSADESFPAGAHLVHDVGAGELLPVGAVSDGGSLPAELPLGVPDSGMPSDLARGHVVDVWAVPTGDRGGSSTLALKSVTVVSVAADGQGGVGSDRQVLVSLPRGLDVAGVLDRLRDASIVLVRTGG